MPFLRPLRVRRRLLAIVLAAAAVVHACAPGDAPGADGPWPMEPGVPGVLGYMAVALDDDGHSALLEAMVGAAPRGIGGGPLLVMPLDPKVLGGALGVVLPVRDAELFEASLRLMPNLAELDDGRWRLTLPEGSRLAQAMGVYEMLNVPPSALGALGALGPGFARALGGGGERVVPVEIDVADGWAAVVPAFEARGAAHRLRRRLTGLGELAPRELVAVIDVERLGRACAGAFDIALQRMGGALQTARSMQAREDVGGSMPEIDLTGLPDLPGLLGLSDLLAVRLRATLPSVPDDGDAPDLLAAAPPGDRITVDLRWRPGSRLDALMSATAPAPEVPGAWLVERWRSEWWRDGEARDWIRPLLDLQLVEASWREVIDEVNDRLERGDGLLVFAPAGEAAGVFVTMAPGESFDWAGLAASVAGWGADDAGDGAPGRSPRPRAVAGPDGVLRLIGEGGDVEACAGQTGTVAWCVAGEEVGAAESVGRSIAAAARAPPSSGPWLRARIPAGEAGPDVVVEVTVDGAAGRLDLRLERSDDP